MSCSGLDRDYMELHRNAFVADLHCDTVLRMKKGFDFSQRDTSGHMDIPRLEEGGIDLQVFACYLPTDTPLERCRAQVDEMIDSLEFQISRNADRIAICVNASESENIVESGKIAAFIGIENGVAIANSLENLRHYYDRGVRYMTLTHTSSSDWCISSADTAPAFEGLTDFGRRVVEKMNELRMIVDVSHASVSAVEEVLRISKNPVIASHSCVYDICPHDRNLTDIQIRAIAESGGVIGINFFCGYLSARWKEVSDSIQETHRAEIDSIEVLYKHDYGRKRKALAPILKELKLELAEIDIDVGTVVDHIDYIVKLVGADYVGLGSDFDGVYCMPEGLADCSMLPNITKELINRGYSDKDIKKILGGNFMRVFSQVCNK